MTIQLAATLLVFLFPLAYSPGPGNIFFATNGARFGFSSTIGLSLGYHVATIIVTMGIGMGFISAFNQFPFVFSVIKVVGALYVLWMAWKLFRAGIFESTQEPEVAGFIDGVILLVLNPKAYFIIAVMFSQFLNSSIESQLLLVLWISTIFTINNLIAFSLWTIAGDSLAALYRNQYNAKMLNTVFGLMLAIVGVWMFFI